MVVSCFLLSIGNTMTNFIGNMISSWEENILNAARTSSESKE